MKRFFSLFIAETITFRIKLLCNGILMVIYLPGGTQPSWKITEIPGRGWGGGGGGGGKKKKGPRGGGGCFFLEPHNYVKPVKSQIYKRVFLTPTLRH